MFGFGKKNKSTGGLNYSADIFKGISVDPHINSRDANDREPPQGGENTAALTGVGSSNRQQGNAPLYHNAFIGPILRENRAWIVAFSMLVIAVCEAMVIYRMLPLKERVPYVMEVDAITGRIEIADRVLTKLNVTQQNVDYFLRLWTTRKESLNATTLTDIPKALAWTRGDAVKAFEDWVDKAKPAESLAKDPGTIREVQHQTIGYINDGKVALVRYNLIERRNGVEVSRVPKLLTATVALVPPPPDSKEERDNPIGLVISQFSISTEGSTGGSTK